MQVIDFVVRRFVKPFKAFTFALKVGTASLCILLAYGMIIDAIRYGTHNRIILSCVLSVMFSLMAIEAVALFEFRAVDLFNYGSDRKSELRDRWLGKFVVRVLLLIGNGAILIKLLL